MDDEQYVLHGDPAPRMPNISVGQFLFSHLQEKGNVVAQIDAVSKESQTFPEILAKSVAVAERLRDLGIRPTDVIGISSENNLDYCLPVLAAFYIGAACAPLNPLYTEGELLHTMSISKPSIVFASKPTLPKVLAMADKLGCIRHVVLIGGGVTPTPLPSNVTRLGDFISTPSCPNSSSSFVTTNVDPEKDTCLILCSSGTTGLPKCVELTHRNYLSGVSASSPYDNVTLNQTRETVLGLLPFYHGFGLLVSVLSIIRGHILVVLPRFEERLFLGSVQDYKISKIGLAPPLMMFLAKHPLVDQYDLSNLKTIFCGAAPLSKETQELVSKRLGIQDIRQGYGMTETSIGGTTTYDSMRVKLGSSGRVVNGMSSKVVDLETGKALPRNREGEICFKGPMLMKGYFRNAEATAATIDRDGWLHTGDIGYYDEDGYLFVVDRLKELIKYKGFQVAPAEIEAILLTHKEIRDACVVGKPDDIAGEIPFAFVALQPNAKVTAEEIIGYVDARISSQKKLRGVKIVSEVPRSASGKLLRRLLRSKL